MIFHADVLKWLRGNQWQAQHGYLPKAHAVFADPPYGLEFMAQEWDKPKPSDSRIRDPKGGRGKGSWGGFTLSRPEAYHAGEPFQHWVTEWASLLIDFVHPGAVLAMFGGTRTYHRLAAGLEDAGWEIFDECAAYLYGSGFPKSAALDKLIDAASGAEREVVGISPNSRFNGNRMYAEGRGLRGHDSYNGDPITAPATDAARQWEGYGTALKPSRENIVLARAPRAGRTYAALAQQFGSGALNIDKCRILSGDDNRRSSRGGDNGLNGSPTFKIRERRAEEFEQKSGRFPANTLFVCACEGRHEAGCPVAVLDRQSGDRKAGGNLSGDEPSRRNQVYGSDSRRHEWDSYNDSGGASRFFYQAKAAAWEREAGLADFQQATVTDGRETPIDNPFQRGETQRRNSHPTVKPIQLCEYIARLLLPPKLDVPRRLLIPFSGVASEMIGAALAGWDEIVGVEMTAEYIPIAEARLAWWAQFQTYEQAELAYRPPKAVVLDDYGDLPLFMFAAADPLANDG